MNVTDNDFNPSYTGPRPDIQKIVPQDIKRVLDFGCNVGSLGNSIASGPNHPEVYGVELDEKAAEVARESLVQVVTGDLDTLDLSEHFQPDFFDCMIFSDVLDDLKEPWDVLKNAVDLLADDGYAVISIPNIRHYTSIMNLIFRGYWPYRDRGLHDRTHLRWFTLKNIRELCDYAGLEILSMDRNYRIWEKPLPRNRFARYFAIWPFKEFLVFQYLMVTRKRRSQV